MENENLKPIEKLTPFTKMIMTIGTLPSSFYASMSYYESMVWLYEYLKNQVIPAVNNNGEAVEELQAKFIELKTYIDEYFDNLDIQEEVNKKLDEMAEDGTITNLIKQYIDPLYQSYEEEINSNINTFKGEVETDIYNQNAEIGNFKNTVNTEIDTINHKVDVATSGSPAGVYATVSDLETADPDHDKIYVVTADGKWYYYTNNTWTAGGTYQATSISDSDPVITSIDNRLDNLEIHYENLLNEENIVEYKIINASGEVIDDANGKYFDQLIEVNPYDAVILGYSTNYPQGTRRIYYFDVNHDIVDRPAITNNEMKRIPVGVKYVSIQLYITDTSAVLLKSVQAPTYSNYFTANDKYSRDIIENNKELSYNLVDKKFRYENHMINNNNEVVSDAGSVYYNHLIDATIDKTFTFTCDTTQANATRRVYLYDENYDLLERPEIYRSQSFTVSDETKYIMIQTHIADYNVMIVSGSRILPYMDYQETFVDKNLRAMLSDLVGYKSAITKLYDVWEPATATSDYECPLGYDNANLSMTYQQLLTQYFDPYIYQNYTDYKVNKKTLGQDSANSYYEMFYYEFIPKNYKYTVLISAGMNTCELAPIFGLGYFLNALMNSTDEGLKALHDSTRFVVLPIICPSSFESNPKKYLNYNGVRINKNFNYLKSWDVVSTDGRGTKGTHPDSEIETKMLKQWLKEYTGANLWLDCHADLDSNTQRLFDTICSSQAVINKILPVQSAMQTFYVNKGYIADPSTLQNRNRVEQNTQYPKTLYSYYINNIPAIMVEQFAMCTAYGASGTKQCEANSIKNYATMISQYSIAMLKE